MHILLNAGGMFLTVLLGCLFILHLVSRNLSWELRGMFHLLVLGLPLASAFPLIGGWVHVSALCCIHDAPYWDHFLDLLLLLSLSCILCGALFYGGFRLLMMHWLMKHYMTVDDPHLQAQVDYWARAQGLSSVMVRLCSQSSPIALAYGIRRPTILLSRWMLEQLDEQELEAVVTHELMHISRHDYLLNWIATMLRDAFFYLPTSQRAYQQFRREKELACDDLVVAATRRPLALASALTKVWLHLGEQPRSFLASFFVEQDQPLTSRGHRLLSYSSQARETAKGSISPVGLAYSLTVCIVLIGLTLMGIEILCWPSEWLWNLF